MNNEETEADMPLMYVILVGVLVLTFFVIARSVVNKASTLVGTSTRPITEVVQEIEDTSQNPRDFDGSNNDVRTIRLEGNARANWFYKGTFPVELIDSEGQIITLGLARTFDVTDDPEEFISFQIEIEYVKPSHVTSGIVVLRRANPFELDTFDEELRLPIVFE